MQLRVNQSEALAIKGVLLNLTTRSAFKLFILALALGAISIALDLALPWLPAAIVATYGGCLLYSEIKGHVSHSDLTNNSPYFLGFVLFLFSLFVTFTRYALHPEQMQMGFVIRELGASLLTTVVGLPFRQWLFAYDPGQQEQDAYYRTLEEELRRSAGEFKRSQVELVKLVSEFVETRKTLFADEQLASESYISNLKRAISVFDGAISEYPITISSALDSCSKTLTKLKTKIEALTTSVDLLDPTQLQQTETEFQNLKDQTVALRENLEILSQTVIALTSKADAVPEAASRLYNTVSKAAMDGEKELRTVLSLVVSDVGDIDKLLTEFVSMQANKINGAH